MKIIVNSKRLQKCIREAMREDCKTFIITEFDEMLSFGRNVGMGIIVADESINDEEFVFSFPKMYALSCLLKEQKEQEVQIEFIMESEKELFIKVTQIEICF